MYCAGGQNFSTSQYGCLGFCARRFAYDSRAFSNFRSRSLLQSCSRSHVVVWIKICWVHHTSSNCCYPLLRSKYYIERWILAESRDQHRRRKQMFAGAADLLSLFISGFGRLNRTPDQQTKSSSISRLKSIFNCAGVVKGVPGYKRAVSPRLKK